MCPIISPRRLNDGCDVEAHDRMWAGLATTALPRSSNLFINTMNFDVSGLATHRNELSTDEDVFCHGTLGEWLRAQTLRVL